MTRSAPFECIAGIMPRSAPSGSDKATDPSGKWGENLFATRRADVERPSGAWTCDEFQRRVPMGLRTKCRFDAAVGAASSAGKRRAT